MKRRTFLLLSMIMSVLFLSACEQSSKSSPIIDQDLAIGTEQVEGVLQTTSIETKEQDIAQGSSQYDYELLHIDEGSKVICDACGGSGNIHCSEQKCLACDGSGIQPCPRCEGIGFEEDERTGVACLLCDGQGTQKCLSCDGTGLWTAWDEMCRGCDGRGVIFDNPENICLDCGVVVEGDMWIHVLLTHKGGELCPICNEPQDDLNTHTLRAHWDPMKYEFTYVRCPVCGEMTKFDLDAHVKIHPDFVACELCGAYCNVDTIREHYHSFHGDTEFTECIVCGQIMIGDIEPHMKTHSQIYHCSLCGEYVRQEQVTKHNLSIHGEIYGPECPVCHVKVIGSTLEEHMNKAHSQKIQCPICEEYVSDLEDHKLKTH